MISQLRGTLVESTPSAAVVDVAGVGYELGISGVTAAALPEPGGKLRLFTRLQVRQDALTLFGFATPEERAMFDRLVAVSSIGAMLALAVLSTFTVTQICAVVMDEDATRMTDVPGVGKKTAQRLILELKSTLAKAGELHAAGSVAGVASATTRPETTANEARAALLSMGFSPQEADVALGDLSAEDRAGSVEAILAASLRQLGSNA